MKKSKQMSSFRELQLEKERLSGLLKEQKAQLDERMDYLQRNAASIFVSTFSYHLILKQLPIIGDFIAQRDKDEDDSKNDSYAFAETQPKTILQKAAGVLPVIWKIARPIVFSVALRRFQTFFTKKLR
ncbi:MAG: hypothetical protein PUB21_12385 [Bacteroidales bacterium]|nr:hypothetical protein [Bacteroidales bacterium]